MYPTATFANECANLIISKTKTNRASITAFTDNVCKPHLLILAKHPVRRNWNRMSSTEQAQQINYACRVFYSVAGKLAKFDPKNIKWTGSTGTFKSQTITVGFTGNCVVTTACIKDYPCLQNTITDWRKAATH